MKTDLEISKALALAIGWPSDRVFESETYACIIVRFDINYTYRRFDYRDWNVISPIAERYECFPLVSDTLPGQWVTRVRGNKHSSNFTHAATPQKAIALAVIQRHTR